MKHFWICLAYCLAAVFSIILGYSIASRDNQGPSWQYFTGFFITNGILLLTLCLILFFGPIIRERRDDRMRTNKILNLQDSRDIYTGMDEFNLDGKIIDPAFVERQKTSILQHDAEKEEQNTHSLGCNNRCRYVDGALFLSGFLIGIIVIVRITFSHVFNGDLNQFNFGIHHCPGDDPPMNVDNSIWKNQIIPFYPADNVPPSIFHFFCGFAALLFFPAFIKICILKWTTKCFPALGVFFVIFFQVLALIAPLFPIIKFLQTATTCWGLFAASTFGKDCLEWLMGFILGQIVGQIFTAIHNRNFLSQSNCSFLRYTIGLMLVKEQTKNSKVEKKYHDEPVSVFDLPTPARKTKKLEKQNSDTVWSETEFTEFTNLLIGLFTILRLICAITLFICFIGIAIAMATSWEEPQLH